MLRINEPKKFEVIYTKLCQSVESLVKHWRLFFTSQDFGRGIASFININKIVNSNEINNK